MNFDKEKLKFWKKVRPEVSKEQEESNLGQNQEPKPKVKFKDRWHAFLVKSKNRWHTFKDKSKHRWHTFLVGTEEKPRHPFTLVAKLYRWYLKKFRGYVDLITTEYDDEVDELIYKKKIVKRKSLPRECVHVTKQKNTHHLDLDLPVRGFDVTRDRGFTASSAFNYMKNNAFNDAMVYDQDTFKEPMDKNKVLVICAVAFGAFLAFYLVVVPMYM